MPKQVDKTSIPWPAWMLRYIASDDEQAFWDLIWSVGGSPPYGGVNYEEAAAVYELIEDYRGPGTASKDSYDAALEFVRGAPYREAVLQLFRLNDEITSNHETFTDTPVNRGLELSEQIKHEGVHALFLAYKALCAYRKNDLEEARKITIETLPRFLRLADEDPVYAKRAAQNAQNAISFTAMSGDEQGARKLQKTLAAIMEGFDFDE